MDHELDDTSDGAPLETESLIRCPHCAQRVAADAESCFRCHQTLFFDVVIEPPVERAAERYELARALASVASGSDVEHLQAQLAITGAPLAERLTRAKAEPIVEVLEAHGLEVHLFPSAPEPPPRPLPVPTPTFSRVAPAREGSFRGVLGFLLLLGCLGRMVVYAQRLMVHTQGLTGMSNSTAAPAVKSAPAPALLPLAPLMPIESTAVVRCAGSVGAGFFVTPDKLVTADHLLCADGQYPAVELHDGRKLLGTRVAHDASLDLAVLHVLGAGAKPLSVGDASTLAAGEEVTFVDSGLVIQKAKLGLGIVSLGVKYLQLAGNRGPLSTGGPVLDSHGSVIGMVSAHGLALPINYLFAGERPLLHLGGASSSSQNWNARLIAARAADAEEVRTFSTAVQRPALIEASSDHGAVDALVLLKATAKPHPLTLRLFLREGGRIICQHDVVAADWVDVADSRVQHHFARRVAWMRAHHLDRDVFGAVLRVDWPGCLAKTGRHELLLAGSDMSAAFDL